MGADYSFYVKTIETHARAFLTLNILAIGRVATFTNQNWLLEENSSKRIFFAVAGRLPAVSSATASEESEGENFIVAWFRSLGGATSSATDDRPEETDYHSSNNNNKEAAENDERAWSENESSHAHNQAFTTTTTSSSGAKGVVIPKYYLPTRFWTKSWTTKTTEQIASIMTHTSLITTIVVVLDMLWLQPFLYNDGMR